MCGACSQGRPESLVSWDAGDVVEVIDASGVPPRVGRVEGKDREWGVAVIWEDGSRTWFAFDRWCPLSWGKGFSMVFADAARFQPSADFVIAPEEVGRGWLPKPPSNNTKATKLRAEACEPEALQQVEAWKARDCGPFYQELRAEACEPEEEALRAEACEGEAG